MARLTGNPKKEYLHAEIACLLHSPKDITSLFIVRLNRKGDYVLAKPCEVCEKAIRLFNPNLKVFYT